MPKKLELLGILAIGMMARVVVLAQPTVNILQRVCMIETIHARGTMFSIDIEEREYWITARHLFTGAKSTPFGVISEKQVDVRILNPAGSGQEWITRKFSVLQPDADVDIVVLAAEKPLLGNAPPSPIASSDGLTFGGSCEFLGFPYGGGWKARTGSGDEHWFPFVKRCSVSAHDRSSRLWILDGINNAGFSGGPVIAGTNDKLRVVAVVSGYRLEPLAVSRRDGGAGSPDIVSVNAGFIYAYDIDHAIQLIRRHPIGPRRAGD